MLIFQVSLWIIYYYIDKFFEKAQIDNLKTFWYQFYKKLKYNKIVSFNKLLNISFIFNILFYFIFNMRKVKQHGDSSINENAGDIVIRNKEGAFRKPRGRPK